MTRRHTRPFIALVAAYTLALQAIFAGLVLGARSGEAALLMASGLCLTGEPQGDQAPADRMPCCVVAACCPANADPAAQLVGAAAPAPGRGTPARIDPVNVSAARVVWQRPHQPRAPPAA
jgi:hypothetical protein